MNSAYNMLFFDDNTHALTSQIVLDYRKLLTFPPQNLKHKMADNDGQLYHQRVHKLGQSNFTEITSYIQQYK